jgi:hypothetical protein
MEYDSTNSKLREVDLKVPTKKDRGSGLLNLGAYASTYKSVMCEERHKTNANPDSNQKKIAKWRVRDRVTSLLS